MRHRHLLIIVFLAAVAPYAGADHRAFAPAELGADRTADGAADGTADGGIAREIVGAGVRRDGSEEDDDEQMSMSHGKAPVTLT
jgi:hypothetical protein